MGLFKRRNKDQKRLIDEIKKESISMEGLLGNIQKMDELQVLYKELCSEAHPDRFMDSEKQEIAKQMFQKIQANKYNYEELVSIKQEMEVKLLK
jgi:hypothetical protein